MFEFGGHLIVCHSLVAGLAGGRSIGSQLSLVLVRQLPVDDAGKKGVDPFRTVESLWLRLLIT